MNDPRYINRTRMYEINSPVAFLDCLHDWSTHWRRDNFSIFLKKENPGFAFKDGNQFRLTLTAPVFKSAKTPMLITTDDEMGKALLSYYDVRKWDPPLTYRGCLNYACTSRHLCEMFSGVCQNFDFTDLELLEKTVGPDCPGLDRYRTERKEDEDQAARDFYHRAAIFFLTRTRFPLAVHFTPTQNERALKEIELFDFDRPIHYILGRQQSFAHEMSTPQPNEFKINIDSSSFTTFFDTQLQPRAKACRSGSGRAVGVLLDEKPNVVPEQDETNELIMHQNLLAVQVVQTMLKNKMTLNKTYTAAWQTMRGDFHTYERTDSLLIMIFHDKYERQSVMVLHGCHRLDGKDLALEPLEADQLQQNFPKTPLEKREGNVLIRHDDRVVAFFKQHASHSQPSFLLSSYSSRRDSCVRRMGRPALRHRGPTWMPRRSFHWGRRPSLL